MTPLETLAQDIRWARRSLLRTPWVTAGAVAALTIGIGLCSAVFIVVHAVLLQPLPYPEPDRIVMVMESNPEVGLPRFSSSPPNYADWTEQSESFRALAAIGRGNWTLAGSGETEPERVNSALVTASFFDVMGVVPEQGRVFTEAEDRTGAEPVVVLGFGLWQRRFGSDPGVVGETVEVEGQSRRVVGVMPEGFKFPTDADLWAPLALQVEERQRGAHFLTVVGRLGRDVGLDQARSEMEGLAARLAQEHPQTNEGWSVVIERISDLLVEEIRPELRLLQVAVALLFLIACANVANLLVVRAVNREREVIIRSSLGGRRGQLVRSFVVEGLLLSSVGGLLGLLLGYWATEALVAISADSIPRSEEIGLGPAVVLATAAIAVFAGLLVGIFPGLQASRCDFQRLLREESGMATVARRGRRLLDGLVVAEVALAVVVLLSAGLLVRSLVALYGVSPGFDPDGALTARMTLPRAEYPDPVASAVLYRELLPRLEGLQGVEAAAVGSPFPLGGDRLVLRFAVQGRPAPSPDEAPTANVQFVTPGYLETMGIPVIRGRSLEEGDDRPGAPPALVVSRSLAERFWTGADALGQFVTFGDPTAEQPQWVEIVGIAGDVRHERLEIESQGEAYVAMSQGPQAVSTLVVRTAGDPAALAPAVRDVVHQIDPNLPVDRVRTLEDLVASSLADRRLSTTLLSGLALVALLLAVVGVSGVLAHSVSRRHREIGLRMALGAAPSSVRDLVLRQALILVGLGTAIGLAGAVLASRLLEGLLWGVRPLDPWTYGAVTLFLLVASMAGAYLPARRATRVAPAGALRAE